MHNVSLELSSQLIVKLKKKLIVKLCFTFNFSKTPLEKNKLGAGWYEGLNEECNAHFTA